MSDSTTPLKKCTKCGNEYPETSAYFQRSKKYKCGLEARCKECAHKQNNPEHYEFKLQQERRKNEGLKLCSVCNEEKPATTEYFQSDKSRDNGLSSACKICISKRNDPVAYQRKLEREHLEKQGLKRCSKCKECKPATDEYFIKRNNKFGYNSQCKTCTKEYQRRTRWRINLNRRICRQRDLTAQRRKDREYRQRNRGWIILRDREYQRRNRERFLERGRKYREKNREALNSRHRKYYHRYHEKHLTRQREYRKNNPHVYVAAIHKRRARKLALPDTFTPRHWLLCLEYWHYCCAVCGNQLRDLFGNVKPHADHWIPIEHPECPGTTPDNMICLCNSCNSRKNDIPPLEWLNRIYSKNKTGEILKRIEAYFEWIKHQ